MAARPPKNSEKPPQEQQVACGGRYPEVARPERFELPTFWFVGRLGFCRFFQINKLDGPPSPDFPPRLAEARRPRIQPYVTALPARLLSTRCNLSRFVEADTPPALREDLRCRGKWTHGLFRFEQVAGAGLYVFDTGFGPQSISSTSAR